MVSTRSLPITFNPPGVAPPSKPTFSHVSTFTIGRAKIITVAGQIGIAADGTIPPTLTEQVENAIRNVKLCLAAAGATQHNIMTVTHYVVNYDPTEKTRQELWAEFLDGATPPGTLVPLEKLAGPGLLFEVEVMAVVEVDEEV